MCLSLDGCFSLCVTWLASLFLIHFSFSISITILLYGTIYFWLSIAIFAFLYTIQLCFGYAFYLSMESMDASRGSTKMDVLLPYLFGCYMCCPSLSKRMEDHCCTVHKPSPLYLCCCCCSILPIAIWCLLTPLCMFYSSIDRLFCAQSDSLHTGEFLFYFACYLFPLSLLHVVILSVHHTHNLVLYALLFISVFIAILWCSCICVLVQFSEQIKFVQRNKYSLSVTLGWFATAIEWTSLILFTYIFARYWHANGDLFNYLSVAGLVLSVPFSLPILGSMYYSHEEVNGGTLKNWLLTNSGRIRSEQVICDQIYAMHHVASHNSRANRGIQHNVFLDMDEPDDLLLNNDKHRQSPILPHRPGSVACMHYQRAYFELHAKQKLEYVKQFKHVSAWTRVRYRFRYLCWWLIALYLAARVYMQFVFPFYWFFYLYFYRLHDVTFCNGEGAPLQCVDDVFVVCMLFTYCLLLFVFGKTLWLILRCEYWYGYLFCIEIPADEERRNFRKVMRRNQIIFEMIQPDIATIICTFLPSLSLL